MKKALLLLALCAIFGCKTDSKMPAPIEGYRIVGEAPGVYNGIRVYLNIQDQKGRLWATDTAIVVNERFTFEGDLETPHYVELTMNSTFGTLPLILEHEEVQLTLDAKDVSNSSISSAAANDALKAYNKTNTAIDDEYDTLAEELKKQNSAETADPAVITKKLGQIRERKEAFPYEFIKEHKDNYWSLILIDQMLTSRKLEVTEIEKSFFSLRNDLTSSAYGQRISEKIAQTKFQVASLTATEIGQHAPNFTAPTPDGASFELYKNLGKVTIIDFWAAWCGPCRRENPNVVKVYNKYHDKGLEIVGVSLDGNTRQKAPKDAWVKAIAQDQLAWHHVSNLNYFNDPVAKAYNIRSIPATFVLDAEGKIIATNLRGQSLENKIAELLD